MRIAKNVGGNDRFVRGFLGASLITWALNGNPEGWAGLFFTLTALLEYCPIRRRLSPPKPEPPPAYRPRRKRTLYSLN